MEQRDAWRRSLGNMMLAVFFFAVTTAIASAGTRGPLAPGFSWDHVIGIKDTQNIRVVYGIKNDVWEAGVGKPLFYARGLYESYEAMGIDPKNVICTWCFMARQGIGCSMTRPTESTRIHCWVTPTSM